MNKIFEIFKFFNICSQYAKILFGFKKNNKKEEYVKQIDLFFYILFLYSVKGTLMVKPIDYAWVNLGRIMTRKPY